MDLRLPNLGEGADSGVVVNVFVKEGDVVEKEQPLLELENEKAVAAIPSSTAGRVVRLFVKAGDKVTVGQRLMSIAAEGESATATAAEPAELSPPPPPGPAPRARPETAAEAQPREAGPEDQPTQLPVASPSIRGLARDLGIDLAKVRGSERGGRIVMADLRAYVQRLQRLVEQVKTGPHPTPRAASEGIDFAKWGPVTVKPLSPLRQVIARRMSESWAAVPRVTQFGETDVTSLLELRKKYAPAYEQKGVRLTLTVFVLKAVVAVLQKQPIFNSSLDATGENLILKAYYHLGIAVDTEAGLIVPVIRDADKKSMVELARELEELAKRARERKVTADEMKGGTFTVSNQGGIGGGHFTPMVNQPETAILGLGRGVLKPVWREGKVAAGTLLPLALSYDHRVIDGGAAARFIVDLTQQLEHFEEGRLGE